MNKSQILSFINNHFTAKTRTSVKQPILKEVLTSITNLLVSIPSASYKVYTAELFQSGLDAPVATVFENTLGGEIVWTRTLAGVYHGTLTDAFVNGKTFIPNKDRIIGQFTENMQITYINRFNNNIIQIETYGADIGLDTTTPLDYILNGFPIEIRVYN